MCGVNEDLASERRRFERLDFGARAAGSLLGATSIALYLCGYRTVSIGLAVATILAYLAVRGRLERAFRTTAFAAIVQQIDGITTPEIEAEIDQFAKQFGRYAPETKYLRTVYSKRCS